MAVKYQIFVSSTYADLQSERDRVIQGILEMGHIPVGMEMFSAANEEQWQIIARHIDESDYYVVIVAHHYGSVVEGISYTRKEYEYALAKGVPIIGFVIEPTAAWPADRIDTQGTEVKRLTEFRALVEQKPVGYWSTADDLYGKSTVALVKAMAANPRVGWVRSSSALGPEVTAEISRLSSENAALRAQLAETQLETERESDLALDKLHETLARNTQDYSIRISAHTGWQDSKNLHMARLFEVLSPMMLVEAPTDQLGSLIAIHSVPVGVTGGGASMPMNELAALLADFMALDLMLPSDKRHAVADKKEYWSLTDRGRALARRLSRRRLEAGNQDSSTSDLLGP